MEEFGLLKDLVVIGAAAIVVVMVLQRLGLPPIAGLIVAGILVGPNGLALVEDSHEVHLLAEVGVVLLLFGIGLELSLERIRSLWRLVVLGGALQVGLTIVVTSAAGVSFGLSLPSSIFLGFLTAISSTAIVLRAMQARGELEAPHGRLTLGVLVFQDLSVVPMVLLIPVLAGQAGAGWMVLIPLGKAVLVLVGVIMAAHLIVPRILHLIAATRQRNLFVLAVFLICMGTAWVVSEAGISLALGAFLAGLVVSGSHFRTQALADLIPMREVMTSIFFVSVGMLFDPGILWARFFPVIGLLLAILFGKFIVMFAAAIVMRLPLKVAVLSGAAVAQIGEFAFVLSRAGSDTGLLEPGLLKDFTAATILSMVITPLMLMVSPHIATGVGKLNRLTRLLDVVSLEESEGKVAKLEDHVIIAGLGVTGKELARSLRGCGVPYIIVDLNPESVRKAVAEGEPAYYGDISNVEVLEHLGIHKARELVIAINDPGSLTHAIRTARRLSSHIHIVTRTRYLGDVPMLKDAGVNIVLPAELEAAVALNDHVMMRHNASEDMRAARCAEIRNTHGEVLFDHT